MGPGADAPSPGGRFRGRSAGGADVGRELVDAGHRLPEGAGVGPVVQGHAPLEEALAEVEGDGRVEAGAKATDPIERDARDADVAALDQRRVELQALIEGLDAALDRPIGEDVGQGELLTVRRDLRGAEDGELAGIMLAVGAGVLLDEVREDGELLVEDDHHATAEGQPRVERVGSAGVRGARRDPEGEAHVECLQLRCERRIAAHRHHDFVGAGGQHLAGDAVQAAPQRRAVALALHEDRQPGVGRVEVPDPGVQAVAVPAVGEALQRVPLGRDGVERAVEVGHRAGFKLLPVELREYGLEGRLRHRREAPRRAAQRPSPGARRRRRGVDVEGHLAAWRLEKLVVTIWAAALAPRAARARAAHSGLLRLPGIRSATASVSAASAARRRAVPRLRVSARTQRTPSGADAATLPSSVASMSTAATAAPCWACRSATMPVTSSGESGEKGTRTVRAAAG